MSLNITWLGNLSGMRQNSWLRSWNWDYQEQKLVVKTWLWISSPAPKTVIHARHCFAIPILLVIKDLYWVAVPPPHTVLVSLTVCVSTHKASWSERSASSRICCVAPLITMVHASLSLQPEKCSNYNKENRHKKGFKHKFSTPFEYCYMEFQGLF